MPKGVRTIYVSATAGGGGGSCGSGRSSSGGNTQPVSYRGGSGGHGACINREPMIVNPQQVIEITVGNGGQGSSAGNGSAGTATIVGESTLAGGGGGIWERNGNGYAGSSPSPNGCDTSSWGSYSSRGSGGAGGYCISYYTAGSAGQNGYVRIEW